MRPCFVSLLIVLLLASMPAPRAVGAAHTAPPLSSSTIDRTIHLVFVEPVGSPPRTPAEWAAARASIADAARFWEARAPITTTLRIADDISVITMDGDIVDSFAWSQPYWSRDLTIFVIDTPQPLLGAYLAQSQTALGLVWAVWGAGDTFAATIAHELGHVVYGLPHQYQEATDIMGLDPIVAYQHHWIGCASLAELGAPCQSVWLPVVMR